eukprot:m.47441 g.47441  ORF g.47441 m.47441 type:complete len:319 (-) comp20493_c0_seq1:32-988(-)
MDVKQVTVLCIVAIATLGLLYGSGNTSNLRAPVQTEATWNSKNDKETTAPTTTYVNSFMRKLFSAHEIETLAASVVFPHGSYFTKYADMDKSLDTLRDTTGVNLRANKYFPGRIFSVLDLVEWNQTFGFLDCKQGLAMSLTDVELQLLTPTCNMRVDQWIYPVRSALSESNFFKEMTEHRGDLHYPITLPNAGKYDFVVFGQTLEHLYDPVLGLKNIADAMAPGGYMFTSVPMLNHRHMDPHFFSMPTPYGLAMWCQMAGLNPIRIGQFGSEQSVTNIGKFPTWWPQWTTYYNKTRNPQVINDPLTPTDIWVLAQKPT